jgi:hypothetical protein
MNKAFVFDFDDTLAETDCKVWVLGRPIDPSEHYNVVRKLTPAEFNTYELKDGESFNFCEFRDDKFIHSANPTWLMALAKEVAAENHAIYILTARENHVADSINAWLISHGIAAKDIYCVGGTKDSIPVNKREILLDIVASYDKIYFYDDSEENVNIFQHEKLRNYLV